MKDILDLTCWEGIWNKAAHKSSKFFKEDRGSFIIKLTYSLDKDYRVLRIFD